MKRRFQTLTGPDGAHLGTLVFRPEEIYTEVRNVAPDLVVHFGGLDWRSVGVVGYRGTVHLRENDSGTDDCNHVQFGAFVLAAPNVPELGEIHSATLLDIAPTLMEVGGYGIPELFQGRSLFRGSLAGVSPGGGTSAAAEEAIRERLSGLGYIS
jgi:predicted AlkP superfamily phosphohydrolase/phosphomutase